MTVILGALAVVGIPAAFIFGRDRNKTSTTTVAGTPVRAAIAATTAKEPARTTPSGNDDAAKLDAARTELASAKDELQKKKRELEDLREQARTKARREQKKDAREPAAAAASTDADPRDVEIQSLRKGMSALESQLNQVKRDREQLQSSSSDVDQRTRVALESAERGAAGERDRRRNIEEENASLKRTIEELRGAIKKVDARPDVPGTTIDLKELPTPAVQELSRFFRKGEEFERLYTVAQSQLQLEKDRFLELQRRYFAVCRELAVQAGLPANAADELMRKKAEAVVDEADAKAAARVERGVSASAAIPGGPDAGAKKRRRRRRRVVGEPTTEEVSGDDGDDGDDDGPDGPDDAAMASVPNDAPNADGKEAPQT